MFSVEKIMMSTEFVDMVSDTVIMHTPVSSVSETVRQDDSSLIPVGGLLGMRVICRNARSLGTVDNILFDPQGDWPIRFLQVKLDREAVSALDLQQSLLNAPLVPVRTVDIRAMGDMIMLDINLEDLRRQIASAPAEGATDNHP